MAIRDTTRGYPDWAFVNFETRTAGNSKLDTIGSLLNMVPSLGSSPCILVPPHEDALRDARKRHEQEVNKEMCY